MDGGDGMTIESAGSVEETPLAVGKSEVDLLGPLVFRTTDEEQSTGRLNSNLVGVGVDLGPVRQADAPVAVAVLLLPGHCRPNPGVSVSLAVCVSPTANLLIGVGSRVPRADVELVGQPEWETAFGPRK